MATADDRTFWGAFVRLLLKCIAALGFGPAAAEVRTAVSAAAWANARTAVAPVAVTAGAPGTDGGTHRLCDHAPGTGGRRVPAPRTAYAALPRRDRRNRTLPPTMKQRICAEAHGASPSPRSVLAAQAPAEGSAMAAAALIPSPRPRGHEALCD
jgi:uncharacterized protein DUF6344